MMAKRNQTIITLMDSLNGCEERGIHFRTALLVWRCMPHTIHLAAIKVPSLPADRSPAICISFLKDQCKSKPKAEVGGGTSAQGSNYQENVTAPPLSEDDGIASDDGRTIKMRATEKQTGAFAIEKVSFLYAHAMARLKQIAFWAALQGGQVSLKPSTSPNAWASEIRFYSSR